MFTNSATKGTSAIVLGAIGLLAPSTASAQAHQAQQVGAHIGISAGNISLEGTGKGVWIHPTGPTGSFHGELYDASGNLRYLMEGGLTKVPGFESMQGPQFGYMDGNLYETSKLGALSLVARVEGQWEKAPNADGRFLAEILEAIDVVNPASLGLIEGEFRFLQSTYDKVAIEEEQKSDGSPQAVFVVDPAGSNKAVGGSSTVDDEDDRAEDRLQAIDMVPKDDDDSGSRARRRRLEARKAVKKTRSNAKRRDLSDIGADELDDEDEAIRRFRAQRLRDQRATSRRNRGVYGTGIDPAGQPGPSATDDSQKADELPVDRVEGTFRLRWTLTTPLS